MELSDAEESLLHRIDKNVGVLTERVSGLVERYEKKEEQDEDVETRVRVLEKFRWKAVAVLSTAITLLTVASPWIHESLKAAP